MSDDPFGVQIPAGSAAAADALLSDAEFRNLMNRLNGSDRLAGPYDEIADR